MQNPIIKLTNLCKIFSISKNDLYALKGIDLEIEKGEFVVIYGPSGSGKTTLLSLLGGLDVPSEGNVLVRGTDIYKLKPDELARYRRNKIGMVFQQFNLVPSLSARDNISLPLVLSGIPRKQAYIRADELLCSLDLQDRANHKPAEMSGGQQQRVAIARAIAANPWILLVDEPTGSLDKNTGQEIIDILRKINGWGRTIVMVTHNPDYLQYGHKIVHMQDGAIEKIEINNSVPVAGEVEDLDLRYYTSPHKSGRIGFWETFRLSRVHFFSKKIRSFLTTLGVALGVGSIVTLVSLGVGLQKITSAQLASLDSLVTISVSADKNSKENLDNLAIDRIKKIPNVTLVSPSNTIVAKALVDGSTTQLVLSGIRKEALSTEGVKISYGQPFTDEGVVITKAAAKNFDVKDASTLIGKDIKIDVLIVPQGRNLTVEELSKIRTESIDTKIVGISSDETYGAAYTSLENVLRITKSTNYNSLRVKSDNRKNVRAIRDQIEGYGYSTTSVVDLIDQVDKVFLITQIILGVIGGVALIVALVGIVNIMTISLLERTHEVGVMKAIGATNKNIRSIFQYEVCFYGLIGGFGGVLGSYLLGQGINLALNAMMRLSGVPGSLNIFVTPVAFAVEMVFVTVLISLLAGFYPSKRASRLSPVEALRYE